MKTATFIKKMEGWRGDARLFTLDPPMTKYDGTEIPAVIVSGVNVIGEPETYIFPADRDGGGFDFGELDGSFKGAIDHAKALENAGYQIV